MSAEFTLYVCSFVRFFLPRFLSQKHVTCCCHDTSPSPVLSGETSAIQKSVKSIQKKKSAVHRHVLLTCTILAKQEEDGVLSVAWGSCEPGYRAAVVTSRSSSVGAPTQHPLRVQPARRQRRQRASCLFKNSHAHHDRLPTLWNKFMPYWWMHTRTHVLWKKHTRTAQACLSAYCYYYFSLRAKDYNGVWIQSWWQMATFVSVAL